MPHVQRMELAVQTPGSAGNQAIEEANAAGQMISSVPFEGLNRITALDLYYFKGTEVAPHRTLLAQGATASQKFKHRNHRTCH